MVSLFEIKMRLKFVDRVKLKFGTVPGATLASRA